MIPSVIHESWLPHLAKAIESPAMTFIRDNVLKAAPFCPEKNKIFKVFEMPLQEVKVVILGQDPYPNPEHAIGLSFAVPNDMKKVPLSLHIIVDEIALSVDHSISLGLDERTPFNWDLSHWVKQGVFLLNTALTVQQGQPGSHVQYWKGFTEKVIKTLNTQDHIIWLLWGANAIGMKELIDNSTHTIFEHTHPAATRFGKAFKGNNHFLKTNEHLISLNREPIKWGAY